jgi:iron complex outermembrane receptor protein
LIETVFCRRFFYFGIKFLLPLILFFGTIYSETLSGYIEDNHAEPVAFAILQISAKNIIVSSDEKGFFSLSGQFSDGDTLLVDRIGFRSQEIVLGKEKFLQIVLFPENIDMRTIYVEGKKDKLTAVQQELIKIEKLSAIQSIAANKLMTSVPGAYVKSYGGSAGISTLSMDGAPTRHTKILVSGFDITNAQNGQVDLSQLPQNFIENIAYDPYSVSAFENFGSEGSVNISPRKDNSSLFYGVGSHGQENFGLTLHKNISSLHVNLMVGKNHDDGNYRGYNPVSGKYEVRKNNAFDQRYLSFGMNGVIRKRFFTKFLYLYSEQERGVAGQIWSPTPGSFHNDNFHLIGFKLGWSVRIGAGFFQSTVRSSRDDYHTDAKYGFPYDSQQDVLTNRYKITQNFRLNNLLKLTITLQCNDDQLSSKDTGEHSRLSWIYANSMEVNLGKLKIIPLWKHHYAENLYAENTWNYTLKYIAGMRFFHSLSFNHGTYYYYPSFNDLYWKPGGNVNLRSEETVSKTLDFQFSLLQEKDLKLLFFDKVSDNLVQWVPSQSFWQPKNIAESDRKGFKVVYRFDFDHFPLTGFLNYTYNHTENKSTNKALLYSPKNSGGLNLNMTWKKWQLHYQVHYTGRRISQYSWPKDVMIDKIIEHTAGVSFDIKYKFGKISNSLLVENFTDETYETIKGYPEPGRIIKFRIEYYLTSKKGK